MKQPIIRTAIFAGFVASVLAVNVQAGEITGNGKRIQPDDQPLKGRSECAYSGLNDTYSGDPNVPDADGFFRTQNWGQLPKAARDFLTSIGVSPGTACNPSRS